MPVKGCHRTTKYPRQNKCYWLIPSKVFTLEVTEYKYIYIYETECNTMLLPCELKLLSQPGQDIDPVAAHGQQAARVARRHAVVVVERGALRRGSRAAVLVDRPGHVTYGFRSGVTILGNIPRRARMK